MNFTCDDNSYRSTQAASDLTSALQAELMNSSDCDWVERAELEKVDQEFKLASFGLMDRSEAIRFGRWTKADWAVFGRISTNSATGRSVLFEVVDLSHADVLAQSSLVLDPQEGVALKLSTSGISSVATTVRQLITQAARFETSNREKRLVAFLFLTPDVFAEGLTDFPQRFQQQFETQISNAPFHLLHFQRAAVSQDESELVLSGLAQTNGSANEKLADLFVWGNYTSRNGQKFDPIARRFNPETIFQATFSLWDGNGDPRTITLSITNENSLDSIALQLARGLVPSLESVSTAAKSDDSRQRAAQSVLNQAMALVARQGNPFLGSLEGRRKWLNMVQMFETACFFDPGNISAREWAARLRWSNFAGYSSRNEFFFDRRRSAAWRKYVEDFGFKPGPIPPPASWGIADSIAKEYVLSAWRPLEMFQFGQDNQAQWGIPRDAGAAELVSWRLEFAREFFPRLLRAPEDPAVTLRSWDFFDSAFAISGDQFLLRDLQLRQRILNLLSPRLIELQRTNPPALDRTRLYQLTLHYQQLGQPGGEKPLVAKLTDAARSPAPLPVALQHVKLPRISVLDRGEDNELFELPSASFRPASSGPEEAVFSLAPGAGIQNVKSAVYHRGKIYLALEAPEAIAEVSGNASGDPNLGTLHANHMRLWALDLQARTLVRISGPLASNSIASLFSKDGSLWASLSDAGVLAWNSEQDTLKYYGSPQGLPSLNCYGLVGGEAGFFALGGIKDLAWLKPGSDTWVPVSLDLAPFQLPYTGEGRRLALSSQRLLFYSMGLVSCDLRSNAWVRADLPISAASVNSGAGRVSEIVGDGQGGFWIASESGLHSINGRNGSVHSQWLHQTPSFPRLPQMQFPAGMRLPAAFQPRQSETDVQAGFAQLLELRHRWAVSVRSNTACINPFKPSSRLPGPPQRLAIDGDYLWVLTSEPQVTYSSVLLLYDLARNQWINSTQVRGDRLSLIAQDGKAWLISASPQEMDVHVFDLKRWLETPAQSRVPDVVSVDELAAFIGGLSPKQQAFYRLFWGEPERSAALMTSQNQADRDPGKLFVLSLAYDEDGLNQVEESKRAYRQLVEEFPENRFAQLLQTQQGLGQLRERARERKNAALTNTVAGSANANREELASRRAADLLRDYDANSDGILSVEELAVACELEPDRLPLTPYPFDPKSPLDSARNLMKGFLINPTASLNLDVLQKGFLRHSLRSEINTGPRVIRVGPLGFPPVLPNRHEVPYEK